MPMKLYVGDIIQTKKNHPCGGRSSGLISFFTKGVLLCKFFSFYNGPVQKASPFLKKIFCPRKGKGIDKSAPMGYHHRAVSDN